MTKCDGDDDNIYKADQQKKKKKKKRKVKLHMESLNNFAWAC